MTKRQKKRKTKRVSRPIVIGHLERVSSKVFDRYRKQITDMIRGNYGVYALYRREKLYYVGLATDFRRRINQHLRDRHKGKWNYFSLYLIRKIDHLREIEALLVRIGKPGGNKQKGKLKRSKNLRPRLKHLLTEDTKRIIEEILGIEKQVKDKRKSRQGKSTKEKRPISKKIKRPLKGKFESGKVIYATYKGKEYKAWVYGNGGIRFQGKIYETPSGAGKAILDKGAVNGWNFWKYKNSSGELIPIGTLRQ